MNFEILAERLSRPEPPWLYRADDAVEPQRILVSEGDMAIFCLDSATMTTVDDFFEIIARELLFPDYFGRNWPAFDECLADIYEWYPMQTIVLVFAGSEALLSRDTADLPTLFRILTKVSQELADEVIEGQPWDRPSVAFHVVFDLGIETTAVGRSLPLLPIP
ncbi:barstar family protein [Nonomuraea sp. KM90]|uniref:barstar family protein n=1 Tax=Nonomuraea sp. KM90 TaxID=3457428 RepID=UPI003FCD3919